MPSVALHIVTWNGIRYLPYCFLSLQRQTYTDTEIYIFDNNSTDGTMQWLEAHAGEYFSRCRVDYCPINRGFAGGHNYLFSRVLRAGREMCVMLINQDVYLEPTYIEKLVTFLEREPRAGVCSGLLKRWNFEALSSLTPAHADVTSSFGSDIDSAGIVVSRARRAFECVVAPACPTPMFGVSGTLPCFRVAALRDIAINDTVFDPLFGSYKEDVDVAYRVQSRGWDCYLVPSAIAYHDRTVSSRVSRSSRSFLARKNSYRNHLMALIKNEYSVNFLKDGFFIIGYELCKALYLILREPCVVMYAWLDIVRNFSTLWATRRAIISTRKRSAHEVRTALNYGRHCHHHRKLPHG